MVVNLLQQPNSHLFFHRDLTVDRIRGFGQIDEVHQQLLVLFWTFFLDLPGCENHFRWCLVMVSSHARTLGVIPLLERADQSVRASQIFHKRWRGWQCLDSFYSVGLVSIF